MTKDLVQALEELIAAAPGADAYHLRIQDDFAERERSDAELDALFADFQSDHQDAIETITKAWGAPTWQGSVADDDFPSWSEALLLACWDRGGTVAFIALRHDDDHEPMFIEVGALTDDEVSTLLYTKS